MSTCWSEPGSPVEAPILTPAILPSSDLTSDVFWADISLSFIVVAEPVNDDFLVVPYATTTISSRFFWSLRSKIRIFARALTSTGSIPTYEMVNIFLPCGQVIVNFPFASVTVPTPVPVTLIDAPITGCPSSSDRTVPETFICAIAIPTTRKRQAKSILILFSIKSLSFLN